MSDQPKPPETVEERGKRLEEQRRRLMEQMEKDVATFKSIVKGESAPRKSSS